MDLKAVDKGFYNFCVAISSEATDVRSTVSLVSTSTTESCSATTGSWVPWLVESGFECKTCIVESDIAKWIIFLIGSGGLVGVGR